MSTKPINWNRVPDDIDKAVWDRLTANFWLPEKVPVSNDLPTWARMTEEQKSATDKVFVGLTMLDTLQSEVGAQVMLNDAIGEHERAVFTNIGFVEAVHAKSYSTIFSTLRSTEEIDEIFRWAETEPLLQRKAEIIQSFYKPATADPDSDYAKAMRKAASVMLESFLFYSGFYLPLKLASMGKLTNTADIIRLILRDEGVHGYYIGYKFQQLMATMPEADQERVKMAVNHLLEELFYLEGKYTELIYDPLGWTGNVKAYLRYNANKAMNNLGYDGPFHGDAAKPEAAILAQMAIDANENHDFFSGSGSSYVIGAAEETTEDDWS